MPSDPEAVWLELRLAAPARRALVKAGILTLKDLRKANMKAVAKLHGMGPSTMKILKTKV